MILKTIASACMRRCQLMEVGVVRTEDLGPDRLAAIRELLHHAFASDFSKWSHDWQRA